MTPRLSLEQLASLATAPPFAVGRYVAHRRGVFDRGVWAATTNGFILLAVAGLLVRRGDATTVQLARSLLFGCTREKQQRTTLAELKAWLGAVARETTLRVLGESGPFVLEICRYPLRPGMLCGVVVNKSALAEFLAVFTDDEPIVVAPIDEHTITILGRGWRCVAQGMDGEAVDDVFTPCSVRPVPDPGEGDAPEAA